MEAGLREIADAAGMPLILYLKSEDGFGADLEAGLDAVGRLMRDGVAVAIKYAVVRDDPQHDAYLDGLLRRVDRARVVSGMGERPAVVHMRDYGLNGFTTGSGLHRAGAVQRAVRRLPRAGLDARRKRSARASCRSRICGTRGDPARVLHHAHRAGRHRADRGRFRRSSRRSTATRSTS